MKVGFSSPGTRGFTLLEVALIVVIIAIVIGLLLPALHQPPRPERINCMSHLRTVGVAFRVWSNDHEDKFPWLLSLNKGGTLEYVAAGEVFRHFQIVSNELSDPRVLICPSDAGRPKAESFTDKFSNANLSYFIGIDSDESRPEMILSGDRNITGGTLTASSILVLTTNSPMAWGSNLHNRAGNLLLVDGSVQQVTESALRRQVESALMSDNPDPIRLAIP